MKFFFTPIILLLTISFLFLIPLFKESFYVSHDGEAHVARFAAYYHAYLDGQFPARWAGNLNYGYGSPVFIFYYPLPGTIASVLHLVVSYEFSFKILIAASFVLCFLTFYLWIKKYVKIELAFLGALLYGLAPYHFLNLYVRGDIAELLALGIVPLVFYCIDKVVAKNITYIFAGAVAYALVILSHNGISLIFSPIILGYIFIQSKKRKETIQGLAVILFGLFLSAFFWIPALYESRFTNARLFIGDMYREHFPSLHALFYSDWGFGPDVNKDGGLSPQIGPVYVLLFMVGVLLVILRKKINLFTAYWLTIFFVTVFFTISQSYFLWQSLPLLKLLQFPWRLTSLSSFAAVIFFIPVINEYIKNEKIIYILIITTLVFSLAYTSILSMNSRNDKYYDTYKATTYYHGQASSIWTAGDFSKQAKKQAETIAGQAKISEIVKRSNVHTFTVDANNESTIVDNTVYFPGWKVFVNDKQENIEFQDPLYKGLITFKVPEGISKVKIIFSESPTRLIADIITLISAVFLFCLFIFRNRINNVIKKI